MHGNITVFLEKGTYVLGAPWQLGSADSGTNGYDVSWAGPTSGEAVISGARAIRGWKLSNPANNIWSAPVPASFNTRQLFVNGTRAALDSGQVPVKLHKIWDGYTTSSNLLAHYRNPKDIDFVYMGQISQNSEAICPLGSISGKTVIMASPCWENSDDREKNLVGFNIVNIPTFVENAYELLDQPGQFYLDRKAHTIYYIPRPGQDMRTASVEAPALQSLLEGSGSPSNPIHNISFVNLQFSYATWLQPGSNQGFSEVQAGYTLTGNNAYKSEGLCHLIKGGTCPYGAWTKEPGNVQLSYDQSISFLNDRFIHLGAAALNLDNGSQNNLVQGSVFTDISGNGIEVGNVNQPEAAGSSRTEDITIRDNHLYSLADEFPGGVGILVGYAANMLVTHNQLDHLPYIGISMGWGGWLDKIREPSVPNYSHDNVISDNLIEDFMQTLSDGGGVYTQGLTGSSMANGEKVIGNVIHGQLDWGSAIKSDDGAAYTTYEKNVLYDDIYDWGDLHYDYRVPAGSTRPKCNIASAVSFPPAQRERSRSRPLRAKPKCRFDPVVLKDNYWQQGDRKYAVPGFTDAGNKIIAGGSQAPSSIVDNAGLEPQFAFLLDWQAPGQTVSSPPDSVSIFSASGSKAYITWHPSYDYGSSPVTSYTFRVCPYSAGKTAGGCASSKELSVRAADFDSQGYVIVSGLRTGRHYSASVAANNALGSSAWSIPSPDFTVVNQAPPLPTKPTRVVAFAGKRVVSLHWYRPANDHNKTILVAPRSRDGHRPAKKGRSTMVLGYQVTVSDGQVFLVQGHADFISTNKGGRIVLVIPGLDSRKQYTFSIRAIGPAGMGPAFTTSPVLVT